MDNNKVKKTTKEVATVSQNSVMEYGANSVNLAALMAEEMEGLTLSFDRIKIPAGGGLAYEVPSDNPDNPDMAKEFNAVILYHHPVHAYYKEKYTGGNTPPDCSSNDGQTGLEMETGEVKNCSECEFNKFGSGESGGKACKQRRRLYILRPDEALPVILSIPTCSLSDFSKYITRLLSRGNRSNSVVTKFSLKKAQNAGGISFSQAVLAVDRKLTPEEAVIVENLSEQVKAIAKNIVEVPEAIDEE